MKGAFLKVRLKMGRHAKEVQETQNTQGTVQRLFTDRDFIAKFMVRPIYYIICRLNKIRAGKTYLLHIFSWLIQA